jgi:hypothetical protein
VVGGLLDLAQRMAGQQHRATLVRESAQGWDCSVSLSSTSTVDRIEVDRSASHVRRDHYCPGRGLASLDRSSSAVFEPPSALLASIAWDNGDDTVSAVNVWDNPSAVADFFMERVIAAEGEPSYKPVRHGEPIASYFRQARHA